MTEITDATVTSYRDLWISTGNYGRLEVSRSRYDDTTVSWEVYWPETGFCDVPIAEFTTWQEAQDWAVANARQRERCTCEYIKGEQGAFAWSNPACPVHRGMDPFPLDTTPPTR